MLTEKYKDKIKNYLNFYKGYYKHRFLYTSIIVAALAISGTLLGLKGFVINSINIKDIYYGEKLEYKSYGLFDPYIRYEFKEVNSDTWSENEPYLAGEYQIRGVSKNIFGQDYYGSVQDFKINPLNISVKSSRGLNDSIYGEVPNLNYGLLYGDELVSANFHYQSIDGKNASVVFDDDNFVIVNGKGQDVSTCYNFELQPSYNITLTPRKIVLESKADFTYDGEAHSFSEYSIYSGSLYSNDEIEFLTGPSYSNAGSFNNKLTLRFFNKDLNKEVTNLYYYSFTNDSKINIEKRNITIETGNFTKIYDGKVSEGDVSYSISDGSLAKGDSITLKMPSYVNAGIYDLRPTIEIRNSDGARIDYCYNVKIVPGKYLINPKPITVNISYSNKTYNGIAFDNFNITNVSGLINNDSISIKSGNDNEAVHAGTHDNDLKFIVLNQSGRDVSSNYEINVNSNSYNVSQRSLTIETESKSFKFDGQNHDCPIFNITNGTLAENDTISVTYRTNVKDVGTYDNELTFKVTNSNYGDVTKDYDINIVTGTLTITPNEELENKVDPDDLENIAPNAGDAVPEIDGSLNEKEEETPIGTDMEKEALTQLILKYTPLQPGYTFFKSGTSGDYNGTSWSEAPKYTSKYGVNPQEFVTDLLKGRADQIQGNIDLLVSGARWSDFVPEYPLLDEKQDYDTYSVVSDLKSREYISKGYIFDYINDHESMDEEIYSNPNYVNEEKEYRKFVYDNYLDVPSSTLEVINKIIKDYDLEGDDLISTYENIAYYFKSNFQYNYKNTGLENSDDILVTFLTESKVGYCQHFAGAGTLMLRALGYPARMVSGVFMGGNIVGKTYEVYSGQAHALSEVYIDGKGWVTLEFTVAPLAPDCDYPTLITEDTGQSSGMNGNNIEQATENQSGKTKIDVSFEPNNSIYDGKEHGVGKITIEGELPIGYRVEVTNSPTVVKPGNYNLKPSVAIYDENGNIVNNNFNVSVGPSSVSISKAPLVVTTESKELSLSEIKNGNLDISFEGLVDGDTISDYIFVSQNISSPGTYSNIVMITKIINSNGEDVTSCYDISYNFGTLIVN